MDISEGREQAGPAHPALTVFVQPCTADAIAQRLDFFKDSLILPAFVE